MSPDRGAVPPSGGAALSLAWATVPTVAEVDAAVASLPLPPSGAPRVEIELPCGTPFAVRHVLHAAGFRLEGVARAALTGADGVPVDALRYARLATDPLEPTARFTAVANSVTPRKRLIAHVLITDAAGRVLACETSFKQDFELPGGIVEPDESPRLGAQREMAEEMGVDLPVGRPLIIEWLPPFLGWEDALEIVFDGGQLDAAARASLVPDGHEIVALHWLDQAGLRAHLSPIAADHVEAALEARAASETLYLESGRRV